MQVRTKRKQSIQVKPRGSLSRGTDLHQPAAVCGRKQTCWNQINVESQRCLAENIRLNCSKRQNKSKKRNQNEG